LKEENRRNTFGSTKTQLSCSMDSFKGNIYGKTIVFIGPSCRFSLRRHNSGESLILLAANVVDEESRDVICSI
jgi:hypothetical protein